MGEINILTIFLTGLLTGGLTCLAVEGGLLASSIAQREEQKLQRKTVSSGNALPILSFLSAKLVAYTALGFLLGAIGSAAQLSVQVLAIMQMAVAVFMLGTALNILQVHPLFRYFVIQPPRFLTRLVRKQSKKSDLFAPAILGLLTVFIPCGTTQAMMALAIGSGNPVLGAVILFVFVLGTSPVFFALGYFATRLGDALHTKFMTAAALFLIFLAVYTFLGALSLTGYGFGTAVTSQSAAAPATSSPTITMKETGYYPGVVTVKASSTVTLKVTNEDAQGCVQAFTIPRLNIQKVVPPGTSETITFKAPEKREPGIYVQYGDVSGGNKRHMKKILLKIEGMHCTSCAMNIDGELEDADGVISASTNYAKQQTTVEFDPDTISLKKLIRVIANTGYVASIA